MTRDDDRSLKWGAAAWLSLGLAALPGCPEPAGSEGAAPTVDAGVSATAAETLEAPVEIRYDALGAPHVYAGSDDDVFLAGGYVQARDRLFQIDVNRRAAVGRLAEVFGEARFSGDVQARVIGFADLAERTLARIAAERPADRRLILAFTAGVNRYVEAVLTGAAPRPAGYDSLDFDPEPFTPAELLAIGIRIQFGFSQTIEFDLLNTVLARLASGAVGLAVHAPASDTFTMVERPAPGAEKTGPRPAAERPSDAEMRRFRAGLRRFVRDLDVGEGSNCWVVDGSATADGRPMLANDSHAGYRAPNQMHFIHLNSADAGGRFDVQGMSFVGVPGVHVGHNRAIAWGATTHFADLTDLWDVAVDGDTVTYGGRALPIERREAAIEVRGEGTRTITVERVPGVGVLLPDVLIPVPRALVANGALLLGWPGFEPTADFFTFVDLDRATSLDDFRAAIDQLGTGMQNWHAASIEGVAYRARGWVPDRGPAPRPDPGQVLDGDDPEAAWDGTFLDPDGLPAIDGGRPFIATANNDPWGHTADNDPNNDPFYYGSFYAPGFRAGTLARRLAALADRGGITRTELQALQLDVHSPAAAELIPRLAEAAAGATLAPAVADAVARLVDWDQQMTRGSANATLYRHWVEHLARRILADDLPLLFDAITEAQPVYVTKFLVRALRDDAAALLDGPAADHLLGALAQAVESFEAQGRPAWGAVHFAHFTKPEGGEVRVAVPGGDTTLNVAQTICSVDGALAETCDTTAGAVYRHVYTFAADGTPELWGAWPENNAGTTADWVAGVFRRVPFRRSEVVARTVAITRLPADVVD